MENGGSGIVPDGAKSNIKKSKPNAFFKNRKSNIGKSSYVEEDKHRQGKRVKREFFDEGKREGTMSLSMTNKEAMMEEKAMIGSKEIRKRVTEIKEMGMRGGREATILSLLKLLIL